MAVDIAQLLADSKQAHAMSRLDKTELRPYRVAALNRREAHSADPEHKDPAWQSLMVDAPRGKKTHHEMHEQLMVFYRERGV